MKNSIKEFTKSTILSKESLMRIKGGDGGTTGLKIKRSTAH